MGILKDMKQDVREDVQMKKGFLQATKYLNEHLNSDEIPIYRAHLSWIPVFIRQVPFMLIGGAIGGIVWAATDNIFIGATVLFALWAIGLLVQAPQAYKNISTDILLPNQGIHSKKKLFAVEDDQFARYQYVNDADLSYNSIFQRALEYGDVEIKTIGGSDNGNYSFKCVAKPMALKKAVRAAQNRFNAMNGGIPRQSQGQMGGPGITYPPQGAYPQGAQMQPQTGGRGRKPGGNRRRGRV